MTLVRTISFAVVAAAGFCSSSPLHAQQAGQTHLFGRSAVPQDSFSRPSFRPLRVAKWTSLLGAAGFATYGFVRSGEADDGYSEIEQLCQQDQLRCATRRPDGAYADAALESRYQRVRTLDRQARFGLIAGQVGIAATVVLFLLDMRNDGRPPDIPYVPKGFGFSVDRDNRLELSWSLPAN
jgi:hypothetical protein